VTGVAAAVDGRILESVEAVGKHLLLRFEGGVTVRSHLRLTGRWRVGPAGAQQVGRPWLVLRTSALEASQWNGPVLALEQRPLRRLGPDLLADATQVASLVPRLRRADPAAPLGVALQDQRLVSGIGNMWMSEALWATGLSPRATVAEASDEQLHAALQWAQISMRASVEGTRPTRAVYRRAGRPCRRCGTPIAAQALGDDNRTAYWCPGCQAG
jgi:endonuclease VIII